MCSFQPKINSQIWHLFVLSICWYQMKQHSNVDDDLWWKTTFDWRQSLMVDNLWWKITLDGNHTLMEEDFWWRMNFDERLPLMEGNLWLKMTCDGKRPLMEDVLQWKTTFEQQQLHLSYCWPNFDQTVELSSRISNNKNNNKRSLKGSCRGRLTFYIWKNLFFWVQTHNFHPDPWCFSFQIKQKQKNPGTSSALKNGYPDEFCALNYGYTEEYCALKTGYPENKSSDTSFFSR